jgi:hypothetical protein
MPLAFLVPAFLAGLAALFVPLLVHLRHRERKEPVRFPSLMFLRRIPFREVRRQQIHHWPLFLLRVLALVLVAAAFARPYLPGASAVLSPGGEGGREIVVLLDRSASMGYGTRWDGARDSVRAVWAGLAGGDRVSLVLFDDAPVATTRPTADRALLDAALDQARPGTGATRFAPALRAARDLLAGTELPRRELVLVSDFQRTGWQSEIIEPLPEGTALRLVDLSGVPGFNAAVTGADPATAVRGGRTALTVTAHVAATGAEASRSLRATLALDGRSAGERVVTLEPGSASVVFEAVPLPDGLRRGLVRIASGDSLAMDDEYRFVVERERPVRVLLIEGGSAGFLRRALAISRSPRVEVLARGNSFRPADLAAADVVVLDDVAAPAGEAGRRMEEYVRSGGGLLVVAGARSTLPGWSGMTLGPAVDRGGTPGTVGTARADHPVFEPIRGPQGGGFGPTRIFRSRRLAGDSLDVLARYEDGTPALAETGVGRGRVLVWTSALDNLWSDLPLQPMFLPLAHQLVRHAARYVERQPAHRVGSVAAVGADELGNAEAVVVVHPSGERTRRTLGGEQPLSIAFDEAGYYEVREAGAGGRLLTVLAVNPDPGESRLAAFDPADLGLAAGVVPGDTVRAGRGQDILRTATERERLQSLWWFAFVGVALLLVAETVLGNRLTGFVRTVPTPGETA